MRRRAILVLAAAAGAVSLAAATMAASTAWGARTPEQARMAAVIKAWSARLNREDYDGIARLYAIPAVIVQPPYVYRLQTRAQVARWYSLLPCAGTVVAIVFKGRFATAVFRLGNRRTGKCDAPGKLAAAQFEIVKGKIVAWVQVPVPAGIGRTGPIA